MKSTITATLASASLLLGCAGFVTTNQMKGIEVYRPGYCIIVSDSNASVFTCPNLASSYEIKPRSFLAKNDFSVELSSGMLAKASDNLDTTAILTFLKNAAELAAEAAGSPVSESSIAGHIGLDPGFYFWDGAGPLTKVTVPRK